MKNIGVNIEKTFCPIRNRSSNSRKDPESDGRNSKSNSNKRSVVEKPATERQSISRSRSNSRSLSQSRASHLTPPQRESIQNPLRNIT